MLLLHLLTKLWHQRTQEKGGNKQIDENQWIALHLLLRQRVRILLKRVAFAARCVPPSYLWLQRDVPTQLWGYSCSFCVVVPPERQYMAIAMIFCHQKMGNAEALQDGRLISPKLKIVGTLQMMSRSDIRARGSGGTSNNSSRCDSGVATATAILQWNWRDKDGYKKVGGK